MALGITLLAVSLVMLGVSFILYLDKKVAPIGFILCIAVLAATFGAAIIDERIDRDRDCVQKVETIKGDS